MKKLKTSPFPFLMAFYTGMILISNITSNKQFDFFGYPVTCAVYVYPFTYILSDVFSEVYGYKWSRYTAWTALFMNFLAVLIYQFTIVLPPVAWFEKQAAFEVLLGNTPRLFIAGLLSFMLGDYVNDNVFKKMKKADPENKKFALRAIFSSVCGQFSDSLVFIPVAFLGAVPFTELLKMLFTQTLFKLIVEVCFLPLTKIAVKTAIKIELQIASNKDAFPTYKA